MKPSVGGVYVVQVARTDKLCRGSIVERVGSTTEGKREAVVSDRRRECWGWRRGGGRGNQQKLDILQP